MDPFAAKTPLEPPLDQAHTLVVFPAYFFPEDASLRRWVVVVDGMVTRPGNESNLRTRWSISMMGRLMRANPSDLNEPLFRGRLAPFLAKGLKKLNVNLDIGGKKFQIPRRTNRSGLFKGRLHLDATQLCQLLGIRATDPADAGVALIARSAGIPLTVELDHPTIPSQPIIARCIAWQGLSVVSDIDDTIKDSQVAPLRILLANTFLNEFRSVAGMSKLYRQWATVGADFHYVSSSPWQLFVPIEKLCQKDQFPAGTFHLRSFHLSQDLLRKMLIFRQKGKALVIGSLLKTFPHRKFVLVGDSGERDPEIYCRLGRKFPDQVKGIYIRDLDYRKITPKRLKKLQDGLPPGLCQPFGSADELQNLTQSFFQDLDA